MNNTFSFQDAKARISTICKAAEAGEYPMREDFMQMLARNPRIAVQGYNMFGKIFFWNEASVHLYGYRESEAIKQDLFELVIPPELQRFARDAVLVASKTGKMPEASSCDLLNRNREYITVFSGHIVFQWEGATTPEFYCLDLEIDSRL